MHVCPKCNQVSVDLFQIEGYLCKACSEDSEYNGNYPCGGDYDSSTLKQKIEKIKQVVIENTAVTVRGEKMIPEWVQELFAD